jgi:hypothetical protein
MISVFGIQIRTVEIYWTKAPRPARSPETFKRARRFAAGSSGPSDAAEAGTEAGAGLAWHWRGARRHHGLQNPETEMTHHHAQLAASDRSVIPGVQSQPALNHDRPALFHVLAQRLCLATEGFDIHKVTSSSRLTRFSFPGAIRESILATAVPGYNATPDHASDSRPE